MNSSDLEVTCMGIWVNSDLQRTNFSQGTEGMVCIRCVCACVHVVDGDWAEGKESPRAMTVTAALQSGRTSRAKQRL